MSKKMIKILDQYYNPDNICNIEPIYRIDVDTNEKSEVGCNIWFNCALQQSVFKSKITFAKADGVVKYKTKDIVEALNKGEDFEEPL